MDQIDSLKQEIEQLRHESSAQAEYLLEGELGNFYFAQRNLQLAASFYKKTLEMARSMHNPAGEGATLSNLGNVYAEQGDIDHAIMLYEEALKIARETEDRHLEGNIFNNLGLAYGQLGDEANAKKCYQNALKIAKEVDDRELRENILSNLQLVPGEQSNKHQVNIPGQKISLPVHENKYRTFSSIEDAQTPADAFTKFLSQQRRSLYVFVGCISALALIEAIILICRLQGIIPSTWSLLLDTLPGALNIILSIIFWLFLWFLHIAEDRSLDRHAHTSGHGHNVHRKIDS